MGREVRMIKPGWEHPREPGCYPDGTPRYRGLLAGPYSQDLAEWEEGRARWEQGLVEDWAPERHRSPDKLWRHRDADEQDMSWEEYSGPRPLPRDYMPEWEPGEATLLVMYENTSEGTPISPGFATPEALARWLADTGASAFGGMTASYDDWLATCRSGWSVGMVIDAGVMRPGVGL